MIRSVNSREFIGLSILLVAPACQTGSVGPGFDSEAPAPYELGRFSVVVDGEDRHISDEEIVLFQTDSASDCARVRGIQAGRLRVVAEASSGAAIPVVPIAFSLAIDGELRFLRGSVEALVFAPGEIEAALADPQLCEDETSDLACGAVGNALLVFEFDPEVEFMCVRGRSTGSGAACVIDDQLEPCASAEG